jgi:biopolymer transport protein ExbD
VNFQKRRTEEPELNMTSLIDVVLLLLIFFMLSTRFIDEGRLQVRLPEASLAPDLATLEDAVVLEIGANGVYRLNGRDLVDSTPETLTAALAEATGGDRAAPITLRADARASHQSVVTAMDVAGRAGFRQVNLATVQDAGQQGR